MQILKHASIPNGIDFQVVFTDEEIREILFAAAFRAIEGNRPQGSTLLNHPLYQLVNNVHTDTCIATGPSGECTVTASAYVIPVGKE